MKAYVLPESTPGKLQHLTIFIVSILCGLAVWAWTSGSLFPSILFPGPQATLREGVRMLESGSIIVDAAVSLARIVAGFTIGSAIGIVVGLLIGYFPWYVRRSIPICSFSASFLPSRGCLRP